MASRDYSADALFLAASLAVKIGAASLDNVRCQVSSQVSRVINRDPYDARRDLGSIQLYEYIFHINSHERLEDFIPESIERQMVQLSDAFIKKETGTGNISEAEVAEQMTLYWAERLRKLEGKVALQPTAKP